MYGEKIGGVIQSLVRDLPWVVERDERNQGSLPLCQVLDARGLVPYHTHSSLLGRSTDVGKEEHWWPLA